MYNTFAVICHDRRKLRLISAAPFRDRVVHHVLCRVLEPIWERRLIHDTYACRPDKGTHAALGRCEMFARRYRYVLQCDVHQFFPAIDHAILQQKLARVVTCPRTLALIERILAGGADVLAPVYEVEWFPGDDLLSPLRPRGLPIGNLTSQFWANIYLDSLDQYVKRELKCAGYVRYCDDFLLFHDDKAVLHAWKEQVRCAYRNRNNPRDRNNNQGFRLASTSLPIGQTTASARNAGCPRTAGRGATRGSGPAPGPGVPGPKINRRRASQ